MRSVFLISDFSNKEVYIEKKKLVESLNSLISTEKVCPGSQCDFASMLKVLIRSCFDVGVTSFGNFGYIQIGKMDFV